MTTDIHLSKFAKTCALGFCARVGVAHVQARVAKKNGSACHRARCWKIAQAQTYLKVGGQQLCVKIGVVVLGSLETKDWDTHGNMLL